MAILPIPDLAKDAWTSMRDTIGFNQLEAMLDELKQQGGWEKHLLDLPNVVTQGLAPSSLGQAMAGGASGLMSGFTKQGISSGLRTILRDKNISDKLLNSELDIFFNGLNPEAYRYIQGPNFGTSMSRLGLAWYRRPPTRSINFSSQTDDLAKLLEKPNRLSYALGHEVGHDVAAHLPTQGSKFVDLIPNLSKSEMPDYVRQLYRPELNPPKRLIEYLSKHMKDNPEELFASGFGARVSPNYVLDWNKFNMNWEPLKHLFVN